MRKGIACCAGLVLALVIGSAARAAEIQVIVWASGCKLAGLVAMQEHHGAVERELAEREKRGFVRAIPIVLRPQDELWGEALQLLRSADPAAVAEKTHFLERASGGCYVAAHWPSS